MPNDYFQFQQFKVQQGGAAMKVCTDACIFGAWVAQLLTGKKGRLLDVGTGTGLLTLMVAQTSQLQFDAIDIDAGAVMQAKENFSSSPWSDRLQVNQSDVRDCKAPFPYDYVISNPPFYENDLPGEDPRRNAALHDSGLTLSALIACIPDLLKADGNWAVLLPYHRVDYFLALSASAGWQVLQRLDVLNQAQQEPFRSCLWLGRTGEISATESLVIRSNDQYTPAFRALLGSYYLAFAVD